MVFWLLVVHFTFADPNKHMYDTFVFTDEMQCELTKESIVLHNPKRIEKINCIKVKDK